MLVQITSDHDPTDAVTPTVTHNIQKLAEAVDTTNASLVAAQSRVADLGTFVSDLNDYLAESISFTDYVDDLVKALSQALQMCKYLGCLIPEVGPILSLAVTSIENLKIEEEVRKDIADIRATIDKAQNGFMPRLNSASVTIRKDFKDAKRLIPGWIDTVNTISLVGVCIDSDMEIPTGLTGGLVQLSGKASDQFMNLQLLLDGVKSFITETWEPAKIAVLIPMKEGFDSFIATLSPVLDSIKECSENCEQIKEWFEPFIWVIDKVQWVVDHTIGWLINKVKEALHIQEFMDTFVGHVTQDLNIADAKKNIQVVFGPSLEDVTPKLEAAANKTGKESISETLDQLSQVFDDFKAQHGESVTRIYKQITGSDFDFPPSDNLSTHSSDNPAEASPDTSDNQGAGPSAIPNNEPNSVVSNDPPEPKSIEDLNVKYRMPDR